MYSKITNPKTGRRVSIKSRLGKKIIRNYLNFLVGGATPNPDGSNFYEILGVKSGHTCKQIKKIGRKAMRTYHPDKPGNDDAGAADIYAKISRAVEVLRNSELRNIYDQSLATGATHSEALKAVSEGEETAAADMHGVGSDAAEVRWNREFAEMGSPELNIWELQVGQQDEEGAEAAQEGITLHDAIYLRWTIKWPEAAAAHRQIGLHVRILGEEGARRFDTLIANDAWMSQLHADVGELQQRLQTMPPSTPPQHLRAAYNEWKEYRISQGETVLRSPDADSGGGSSASSSSSASKAAPSSSSSGSKTASSSSASSAAAADTFSLESLSRSMDKALAEAPRPRIRKDKIFRVPHHPCALKLFATPAANWSCNNCGTIQPPGTKMIGCRSYDYDLCLNCFNGWRISVGGVQYRSFGAAYAAPSSNSAVGRGPCGLCNNKGEEGNCRACGLPPTRSGGY